MSAADVSSERTFYNLVLIPSAEHIASENGPYRTHPGPKATTPGIAEADIETPAASPPIKDTTEPSTLPISVRASVVPEKRARTRIQPAPALTLVRDACQGFSQQQRRPKRGNRPPDAFAVVY
ncbi:hypothetical protein C8Q73DRAFT_793461 [Cubamyces lactineus]|nr:hypothetical protein C8Q73DRAFT_793461 [Cubamyces lactineus]